MSTVQLMIKNADIKTFQNWVFSIYKQEEERSSIDFSFYGPRYDSLGIGCLVVASGNEPDNWKRLKPFIEELCKAKVIQVIMGKYTFSMNQEEVNRIVKYLERMARVSDLNHGVLLFDEDENTSDRKVKISVV